MANNVVEILKGVVGELKEMAKSETIIGDPVTIGDTTVVPIVKISFGFGAGGGQRDSGKADQYGGGGGGGARIEPAAFIIIDKDGVSLIPAGKGKLDQIIDAIPNVAKKFSKLAEKFKSSDKKTAAESDGGDGAAADESPE
ncbi:MAG: spore germination protein GerW family protein [bacterium]